MRTWRTLPISTTTRQVIENFNVNAYSSMFMDYVTGTIMNNGLLFTGRETIDGAPIIPLTKVDISGIVNSNVIFDNFRMYFRVDNSIVELNQFPVDLTEFNDNKPHFLYFKKDRTYRVSDYIFGEPDEVLICRFIITEDSYWQQLYITAQRAGTPMYSSGEEFYVVDGINVKSPGGLELSHTDGNVKRSGIEFTDLFSPDLYKDYSVSSKRVPIRYTNLANEIDYTQEVTWEVDPNHYMSYDFNTKKKTNAQERIRNIFNADYGILNYANQIADELHHALTITDDQEEFKKIVDLFVSKTDGIYLMVGDLGTYLEDSYFTNINKTRLENNIRAYNEYITANLDLDTITITEDTVQKIRDAAYFIESGNSNICSDPLNVLLESMYDDIEKLTTSSGVLQDVPEGKFTLQRVLWDIYEKCFILQYGDTLYDTLEDALEDTGSMLYPVPFGHLLYIPLAAIAIKQGCTDINTDTDCIIIIRKYLYADSEQDEYADFVARALANKALKYLYGIIDGTYPVGKADSLKHTTDDGTVVYDDGDYFLNYDNLKNKIDIINNLKESVYNNKHALSAYQGYLLNQNKLNRDGSQPMTGTLQSQSIIPIENTKYDLGSSANRWNKIYTKDLDVSGNLTVTGNILSSTGGQYVVTGPVAKTAVRLEADSKANIDTSWNGYQNGTVAVCW